MDPEKQKELAAEQEAQQELKEDEVRSKIIEEFGFDPEGDKDRIDKLTADKIEQHKKLSTAIGQKIKHRTEAEELKKKVPVTPTEQAKPDAADPKKIVDEALEKRDLDDMDYPEDIKKEIQRVAQIQKVSVKQASRDPYIVTKITEYEKQKKADEAAISRKNSSGGTGKKNYTTERGPEVDMNTKEGREEWDSYVKWLKTQE